MKHTFCAKQTLPVSTVT